MKVPPVNLLLDTHIVIWMATDPDRIPVRLQAGIEHGAQRFVSHVTSLEVQLKNLKSSKAFPFSLSHLERTMKEYSCTELPLTYKDIAVLGQIEFLHSDPFDRLLIAQAINRNLYLATLDRAIVRTFEQYRSFEIFPL